MNTILLTIHIAILPKEILILHCFWKGGKKNHLNLFVLINTKSRWGLQE